MRKNREENNEFGPKGSTMAAVPAMTTMEFKFSRPTAYNNPNSPVHHGKLSKQPSISDSLAFSNLNNKKNRHGTMQSESKANFKSVKASMHQNQLANNSFLRELNLDAGSSVGDELSSPGRGAGINLEINFPRRKGLRVRFHDEVLCQVWWRPEKYNDCDIPLAAVYAENRAVYLSKFGENEWSNLDVRYVGDRQVTMTMLRPERVYLPLAGEDGISNKESPVSPEKEIERLKLVNIEWEAQLDQWFAKYTGWLAAYEVENGLKAFENEHIKMIRDEFHDFPRTFEFNYVFNIYRRFREFLYRLSKLKAIYLIPKFGSHRRFDLVRQLLRFVEKESELMDIASSSDFDFFFGIPQSLLNELLDFVNLPPDDEYLSKRWTDYFTFCLNPRAEYTLKQTFFKDQYLQLLNRAMVQALLSNDKDAVRELCSWKPLRQFRQDPEFKKHPVVRADALFSRRGLKCPQSCSGHQGRLLQTIVHLGYHEMYNLMVESGIPIIATICSGNIAKLEWIKAEDENDDMDLKQDFDISRPDYEPDVEAYLQRKRLRDAEKKQKKVEEDYDNLGYNEYDDDFLNGNAPFMQLLRAERANSEESVDFEGYLAHKSPEKHEDVEPDFNLSYELERTTLLTAAIQCSDMVCIDKLFANGANPMQSLDSGLKGISLSQFKSFLARPYDNGLENLSINILSEGQEAMAEVCEKVVSCCEDILRTRNFTAPYPIPPEHIFGLLLAESYMQCQRGKHTNAATNHLNRFVDEYFKKRSMPKENRYPILKGVSRIGSRVSRNSRSSFHSAESDDFEDEYNSATLTRASQLLRFGRNIGSTLGRHTSRLVRQASVKIEETTISAESNSNSSPTGEQSSKKRTYGFDPDMNSAGQGMPPPALYPNPSNTLNPRRTEKGSLRRVKTRGLEAYGQPFASQEDQVMSNAPVRRGVQDTIRRGKQQVPPEVRTARFDAKIGKRASIKKISDTNKTGTADRNSIKKNGTFNNISKKGTMAKKFLSGLATLRKGAKDTTARDQMVDADPSSHKGFEVNEDIFEGAPPLPQFHRVRGRSGQSNASGTLRQRVHARSHASSVDKMSVRSGASSLVEKFGSLQLLGFRDGGKRQTLRRSNFIYDNWEEEVIFRVVLSVDYLLERSIDSQNSLSRPHVQYAATVLRLIADREIVLDSPRFKKVMLILIKAAERQTPDIWVVLLDALKNNLPLRYFLGLDEKKVGKLLTEVVRKASYRSLLDLNKKNFKFKLIGHRILVMLVKTVGKFASLDTIEALVNSPNLMLTKEELIDILESVNKVNEAAGKVIIFPFKHFFPELNTDEAGAFFDQNESI